MPSLKPTRMESGLLNDMDAEVISARYVMYDFGGRSATGGPQPVAKLVLRTPDGTEYEQYWSCGSAEQWRPSEDGKTLIQVGTQSEFRKSSNIYRLVASLVEAGFLEDRLPDDGDITVLEGLVAHWVRKPTGNKRQDGSVAEVLVVDRILRLPWESEGAKSSTIDPNVRSRLVAAVVGALKAAGRPVPKNELPARCVAELKDLPNEAVAMLIDDAFLGAADNPWKYEDGVLTLDPNAELPF